MVSLLSFSRNRVFKHKLGLWLLLSHLNFVVSSSQACQAPFKEARLTEYKPVIVKPTVSAYTLQMGNRSALERAYQTYFRTGKASNIITEGFVEFAYGAQQPIVPASPFELSVISLEAGEEVTSVSSGDPLRWSYSLAYSGSTHRQAHVMVKPSSPDISTDLVITTNKRFYTLKLVSKQSPHYYRDVRFWYPGDIQKTVEKEVVKKVDSLNQGGSPNPTDNAFDAAHLHFNYRIKSSFFKKRPNWYPVRIFDDGRQTYIQFSNTLMRENLPALFVKSEQQLQIANYRIKPPYVVVDQIFKEALLISGTGKNQERLSILNEQDEAHD